MREPIRSKTRVATSWTSSGSVRSAKAVEPTRSAKRAVAYLRSRPPYSMSAKPQPGQKRASSGGSRPQDGQMIATTQVYERDRGRSGPGGAGHLPPSSRLGGGSTLANDPGNGMVRNHLHSVTS